ncbi:MAG: sulfite exporter TauE/SafE family protein [Smithella sp.]|nr:sulfite exporter TauE/SafE family protein [Smithella sp.]
MKTQWISFAIGLVAGCFGGLMGIGGGIIMIPLMVELLHVDQCRAHGTSLVVLIFTGISGGLFYGLYDQVNWKAAVLLAVPAMLLAAVGARLADRLPDWKLKRSFGAFLIFCSALLLLKPLFADWMYVLPDAVSGAAFIATGAATGFLSGLMGIGGGTIMIPVMILLGGFTQHVAQGTALLVMIPSGFVGAFTHWKLGNVAGELLFGMVPGIMLGAFTGAGIAQFIPEEPLRWMFVLVAVYMGWRYMKVVSPDAC